MKSKKPFMIVRYKDVYDTWLQTEISHLRGNDLDYEEALDIATGKYKPPTQKLICEWYSEVVEDFVIYAGIIIKKGNKTLLKRVWKE